MGTIEGFTKAISKMIEVCANGIVIIYEPRHLIKMTEAYNQAQNLLSSSDTQLTYNHGKIIMTPTQSDISAMPTRTENSINEDSLNRTKYQKVIHQKILRMLSGSLLII